MADVLEDYVSSSLVELVYFSDSWRADEEHSKEMYATYLRGHLSPQGWAYDNCFRMFAYRHKFMLLLDPDEYVILKEQPQEQPHLPSFLEPFEPYGGLAVHWQLFGPSGHVARPNGSTLESYTQCMPKHIMQSWGEFRGIPHGFVKTFTATRCYKRGCNPHVCELKPGCRYVNEKFMDITPSVLHAAHWDRIAIFHYVTRSAQEYKAKMARGSSHSQFHPANRAAGRTNRGWKYFLTLKVTAVDTCTAGRDAWALCCGGAGGSGGGGGRPGGVSHGGGTADAGRGGGAGAGRADGATGSGRAVGGTAGVGGEGTAGGSF